MFRVVVAGWLTVVVGTFGPLPASGQEWARKMFQETNHDFGTVARGAKTEYRFQFTNLYRDDLHVAEVKASCGCTTPLVPKKTLKSREQGEIVAHFNTDRFKGKRGATLTVVFDRPQRAEVQLRVDGFIRGDVVVDPGEVELGTADQGASPVAHATVDHAGASDWRIVEAKSDNPFVRVTATETRREANRVVYDLSFQLSNQAPPGYVNSQVTLVTSDQQGKELPIVVHGRVLPEVTVSPSLLAFGDVPAGKKVTRQIVVRARRPFRISAVHNDDSDLKFELPSEAKTVHLVPVTLAASATPRHLSRKIVIETDLGEAATAELLVMADVVSAAPGH